MATQTFGQLDVRYVNHEAFGLPGGGELFYDDRGDGPPVVFVNNFYIVSPIWRNFTTDLAQDHRLITYDLRNQGASSAGDAPVTFDDHVEDLRRLLDHLRLERATIVGTSISTLIARDFALRYPERVSELVLIGPAFSPNGSLRRTLLTRHWLTTAERGSTSLFDMLYPLVFPDQMVHSGGPVAYLALRDNFLALLSKSSIEENLRASLEVDDDPARLEEIAAPTLFINGDGDFAWSASVIADALARVPDSVEVTLPRAGHVPYFDDPDGFQTALREFLVRCAARREGQVA